MDLTNAMPYDVSGYTALYDVWCDSNDVTIDEGSSLKTTYLHPMELKQGRKVLALFYLKKLTKEMKGLTRPLKAGLYIQP